MKNSNLSRFLKVFAIYLGALILLSGDLSLAAGKEKKRFSRCFLFQNFALSPLPQKQITEPVDYILISKSKKLLLTWNKYKITKAFAIALGGNSVGHKQQEGDGKTPTGFYKIDGKNEKSDFYRSLHISYPNTADVKAAKEAGVSPGGDIMIHGLPSTDANKRMLVWAVHPQFNWTRGCVALYDSEIEEVFANTDVGATVEICE